MSKTAAKLVAQATKWLGLKESDGSHMEIINTYNSHKPLARGYKMKSTDAWCSCFVSACSIATGMTDIVPTEVGCEKHINLFKKLGVWIENENIIPKVGDIVFYDWEDDGKGDNKGSANHVGIVDKVNESKKTFTVIEGNYNNKVARRTMKFNGKYLRGFARPNYESEIVNTEPKKEEVKTDSNIHIVVKGDTLSGLARKYKTTYQRIYNKNKQLIDNENRKRGIAISKMWIYPGQKLVIK